MRWLTGRKPVVSTSIAMNSSRIDAPDPVVSWISDQRSSTSTTVSPSPASTPRSSGRQIATDPLLPKTWRTSASSCTEPPLARTNASARSQSTL